MVAPAGTSPRARISATISSSDQTVGPLLSVVEAPQLASVTATRGEMSTNKDFRDHAQASPSGRLTAPSRAEVNSGVPRWRTVPWTAPSYQSPQAWACSLADTLVTSTPALARSARRLPAGPEASQKTPEGFWSGCGHLKWPHRDASDLAPPRGDWPSRGPPAHSRRRGPLGPWRNGRRWNCSSRSGRRTTARGFDPGAGEQFGVHRRAVRQALASPIPPPRKQSERRRRRSNLEVDHRRLAGRRRRRPEKAAPHRPADLATPGRRARGRGRSESTVRRYVARPRAPSGRRLRGHGPPDPPAGVGGRGRLRLGQLLLGRGAHVGLDVLMRLSASGKGFHHVYANQAQEAFIDGHVRAFEHFGGVPGRIRYDNLKPAVARVLLGRDRTESERFVRCAATTASTLLLPPGQGGGPREGWGRGRGRAVSGAAIWCPFPGVAPWPS